MEPAVYMATKNTVKSDLNRVSRLQTPDLHFYDGSLSPASHMSSSVSSLVDSLRHVRYDR